VTVAALRLHECNQSAAALHGTPRHVLVYRLEEFASAPQEYEV
jgi:hypothetical protein